MLFCLLSLASSLVTWTWNDVESRTKEEVCSRYKELYIPKLQSGAALWTGDQQDKCDPGAMNEIDKEDTMRRIMFYRYLAGLEKHDITENTEISKNCQLAATIWVDHDGIGHEMDMNWNCMTQGAYDAAAKGVLVENAVTSATSIDNYIEDLGEMNVDLGHRRWLLMRRLKEVGIGFTKRPSLQEGASDQEIAKGVIQVTGTELATDTNENDAPFVAYPGPGPQPKNLIWGMWSVTLPEGSIFGCNKSKDITGSVVRNSDGKVLVDAPRVPTNDRYGDRGTYIFDLPVRDNERYPIDVNVGDSYTVTFKCSAPVDYQYQDIEIRYIVKVVDCNDDSGSGGDGGSETGGDGGSGTGGGGGSETGDGGSGSGDPEGGQGDSIEGPQKVEDFSVNNKIFTACALASLVTIIVVGIISGVRSLRAAH